MNLSTNWEGACFKFYVVDHLQGITPLACCGIASPVGEAHFKQSRALNLSRLAHTRRIHSLETICMMHFIRLPGAERFS